MYYIVGPRPLDGRGPTVDVEGWGGVGWGMY